MKLNKVKTVIAGAAIIAATIVTPGHAIEIDRVYRYTNKIVKVVIKTDKQVRVRCAAYENKPSEGQALALSRPGIVNPPLDDVVIWVQEHDKVGSASCWVIK